MTTPANAQYSFDRGQVANAPRNRIVEVQAQQLFQCRGRVRELEAERRALLARVDKLRKELEQKSDLESVK